MRLVDLGGTSATDPPNQHPVPQKPTLQLGGFAQQLRLDPSIENQTPYPTAVLGPTVNLALPVTLVPPVNRMVPVALIPQLHSQVATLPILPEVRQGVVDLGIPPLKPPGTGLVAKAFQWAAQKIQAGPEGKPTASAPRRELAEEPISSTGRKDVTEAPGQVGPYSTPSVSLGYIAKGATAVRDFAAKALEYVKAQNTGKHGAGPEVLTGGLQTPAERPPLPQIDIKFQRFKTKVEQWVERHMGRQTGFPF